jgi:hypothetical protein
MTVNDMINKEMIIAVDDNYLTNDGIILIRAYGQSTNQYWIRDDDFTIVYNSLYDAYYKINKGKICNMRKKTRSCLLDSLRYYLKSR